MNIKYERLAQFKITNSIEDIHERAVTGSQERATLYTRGSGPRVSRPARASEPTGRVFTQLVASTG